MSIIEAMVAGVPVVAARGGAVPDLIANNRTGLLVDVANPSAIADAVIGLAANPQLRRALSTDARSIVCDRFSWDTISSDLLQLYREVLAPASQSAPQPSAYVV
jgi:glycosyltransferase involved in cell wall biosynthesis